MDQAGKDVNGFRVRCSLVFHDNSAFMPEEIKLLPKAESDSSFRIEGRENSPTNTTSNATKLTGNSPSILLNPLFQFLISKSNKVVLYFRILCWSILATFLIISADVNWIWSILYKTYITQVTYRTNKSCR